MLEGYNEEPRKDFEAIRRRVAASAEPMVDLVAWARPRGFVFTHGSEPGEMLVFDVYDRHRVVKRLSDGRYQARPKLVSLSLLAHLQAIIERRP